MPSCGCLFVCLIHAKRNIQNDDLKTIIIYDGPVKAPIKKDDKIKIVVNEKNLGYGGAVQKGYQRHLSYR